MHAVAFQLAAALQRYGEDMEAVRDVHVDTQRYRAASEQLEAIRQLSEAVPQLGALWTELLIAHAELVHALWQAGTVHEVPRFAQVRAHHGACVQALRERCLRFVDRG